MLLDPVQVVVVGDGSEADQLETLAMARFAVNKTVMRLAPRSWLRVVFPRRWPKRRFRCQGRPVRRPGRLFAAGGLACLR